MKRLLLYSTGLSLACMAMANTSSANMVEEHRQFQSSREDKRYTSSRGIAQEMLEQIQPKFAYRPEMTQSEFLEWQNGLATAMRQLMKFPSETIEKANLVQSVQREGYKVEKWEILVHQYMVIPFFVMIPDSLKTDQQVPVVLCIPGSDQTKELLAGESSSNLELPPVAQPGNAAMGYQYVKQGWVAVVVDNAGCGEQGDLESLAGRRNHDYDNLSRFLLEMGWSWLGYTSFTDQLVLNWIKTQDWCQQDRIILSGFSLGTEPMMVLGVLNPDIFAFVYNDFLCRTRERAISMTAPNQQGQRPAPNSIRHLIPGFWQNFDFPDIVASLAPRPVICTEGGLDRDFEMIADAYKTAGKPNSFKYYHQPSFSEESQRYHGKQLPKGINKTDFFRLANVDPKNHYFKTELIIPWLKEQIQGASK